MKNFLVILVAIISFDFSANAQDKIYYNKILFENEKIMIYDHSADGAMKCYNNGRYYQQSQIIIVNKTNNPIRVKYKASVAFVQLQKKVKFEETVIIPARDTHIDVLANRYPGQDNSVADCTIINMSDFELINYAEQKKITKQVGDFKHQPLTAAKFQPGEFR